MPPEAVSRQRAVSVPPPGLVPTATRDVRAVRGDEVAELIDHLHRHRRADRVRPPSRLLGCVPEDEVVGRRRRDVERAGGLGAVDPVEGRQAVAQAGLLIDRSPKVATPFVTGWVVVPPRTPLPGLAAMTSVTKEDESVSTSWPKASTTPTVMRRRDHGPGRRVARLLGEAQVVGGGCGLDVEAVGGDAGQGRRRRPGCSPARPCQCSGR